ncbi:MAG TPA: cytochrome c [Vineibacter sp.]|nr:cytochrome c [Vineibacter sp.]
MRKALIAGAMGVAISGVLISSVVVAQGDPIASRKDNRKQAEAQMRAIKRIIGSKGPADGVMPAAAKLKELSAAFATLFPVGSDKGDTNALPVVWTDMPGFAAANKAEGTAIDALLAAAATGDMTRTAEAFGSAAKACGACHDKFRAK